MYHILRNASSLVWSRQIVIQIFKSENLVFPQNRELMIQLLLWLRSKQFILFLGCLFLLFFDNYLAFANNIAMSSWFILFVDNLVMREEDFLKIVGYAYKRVDRHRFEHILNDL